MKLGRVIAHIPARGGSKRVPAKNLRYLAGRPLISYAIETAMNSKKLDEVYVNTDSEEIAAFSESVGCKVYRRPDSLGSDATSGEEFTIDFIRSRAMDTLVMVSPVCPLLDTEDLDAALDAYASSDADTLIACAQTRLQVFFDDRAVNIELQGPLAPTQENLAVSVCNWGVTIWNAAKFIEQFARYRGGYCGDRRILWPLTPLKAVKISEEADFRLAEALLRARDNDSEAPVRYWQREEV